MDAIFTMASGKDFCDNIFFQVFLKSLHQIDFKGEVVIFTSDMRDNTRALISGYGYKIVEIDPSIINIPAHDRLLVYYQYLQDNVYDRIIFTDSKDVYFQENPFDYINDITNLDNYVLLCGEGANHESCLWNFHDQKKIQASMKKKHRREYLTNPIINSGFILGTYELMKHLSLVMWTNTLRQSHEYTDQAVLNYLYNFLKLDDRYILYTPQKYALAATGAGICQKWFNGNLVDGKLYHKDLNIPYAAFHQWERTGYVEKIIKHMGFYFPRKQVASKQDTSIEQKFDCLEPAAIGFK